MIVARGAPPSPRARVIIRRAAAGRSVDVPRIASRSARGSASHAQARMAGVRRGDRAVRRMRDGGGADLTITCALP